MKFSYLIYRTPLIVYIARYVRLNALLGHFL